MARRFEDQISNHCGMDCPTQFPLTVWAMRRDFYTINARQIAEHRQEAEACVFQDVDAQPIVDEVVEELGSAIDDITLREEVIKRARTRLSPHGQAVQDQYAAKDKELTDLMELQLLKLCPGVVSCLGKVAVEKDGESTFFCGARVETFEQMQAFVTMSNEGALTLIQTVDPLAGIFEEE